jgi:hypothetical protein
VSDAFETWAAGVIYNNQPLPERKGIPYFLAEKAHAAGVREGIRQAREAVAGVETYGAPDREIAKRGALRAIDNL